MIENEKNFLKNLENDLSEDYEEGEFISILIDRDRDLYDYDVLTINDNKIDKIKTYKLPKAISKEWIVKKVNTFQTEQSSYKNLSDVFSKLIKKDVQFYPTTYGIGTYTAFDSIEKLEAKLQPILKLLDKNKIDFKMEFSEAMNVYRIKVGKSSDNLSKINKLSTSSKIKTM